MQAAGRLHTSRGSLIAWHVVFVLLHAKYQALARHRSVPSDGFVWTKAPYFSPVARQTHPPSPYPTDAFSGSLVATGVSKVDRATSFKTDKPRTCALCNALTAELMFA